MCHSPDSLIRCQMAVAMVYVGYVFIIHIYKYIYSIYIYTLGIFMFFLFSESI